MPKVSRLIARSACALALGALSPLARGDNPYATTITSYNAGSNPAPGYTDPAVALGSPTRFTGFPPFEAVVSVFNAPWGTDDIVSIGAGGHLTVSFDSPIVDHPDHPFGVDLLIFSNTWFVDGNYPSGIVAGLFAEGAPVIEVSADGKEWKPVSAVTGEGLFPTIGYLDAGPYDTKPGKVPSDFTLPVDPSLTLDDFLGLSNDQVLKLYGGSGGGMGVDISGLGLDEVHFVRIRNPQGASSSIEIDGFAKVSPGGAIGDLNGDGVVDVLDLLVLLSAWGEAAPGTQADLNGDGTVDVLDLLILLANWG